MKNTLHLDGLILRSVSKTMDLKNGKVKRELELDYGKQRYLIDEIVPAPSDFRPLTRNEMYDVILYVNGIVKDGLRYTRLSLKKIKIHNEVITPYTHEKDNNTCPDHNANDVPANGSFSSTPESKGFSKLIRATFNWQ